MYLMNHRSVLNGTPLDARHDNVALVARAARLRARAVRLHRHQHRPPHGRARRPAAVLVRGRAARLRPGVPPARGQAATRGSTGCAPSGVDVPDDWRAFVDRAARRHEVAHAVRRRAHRRPRSSPTACSTSSTTPRRAAAGRGSRTCRTCGRTRRSSRPRPTTRCTTPRRYPTPVRAPTHGRGRRAAPAARRDDRPPVARRRPTTSRNSASSRRPTTG